MSDAAYDLLRNLFYVVQGTCIGEHKQGSHPTLMDQQTFDEAQTIISDHASALHGVRSTKCFFLLTRLVRCGHCDGTMPGQTNVRIGKDGSKTETRYYRDRTIPDGGTISGKMISANKLEAMVKEQIKKMILPQAWKERIVAL